MDTRDTPDGTRRPTSTAPVIPICEAPGWRPDAFASDLFYTTDEMARILKVDPSTLRRWRRMKEPKGPLATCISDRTWRYHQADFVEWLTRRSGPMDAA